MEVHVCDAQALVGEATRFTKELLPKATSATVVLLSGELGAGKTNFVQGVAKALGVDEKVTSPTFVLEKVYPIRKASPSNGASQQASHFKQLVHIDAYRLKGAHELEALGWKELLADSGNLIILEWPEHVAEAMPHDAIRIRFDIHGDERTISINGKEKI